MLLCTRCAGKACSGTITDADIRRGLSRGFGTFEDERTTIACLKPVAIENSAIRADVFKEVRQGNLTEGSACCFRRWLSSWTAHF